MSPKRVPYGNLGPLYVLHVGTLTRLILLIIMINEMMIMVTVLAETMHKFLIRALQFITFTLE